MSKSDELADVLEEYSTYLELDGQEGRAAAYDRAARSLRKAHSVPPDPSDLKYVGEGVRKRIANYQISGEIDELETLKEKYSWFAELKDVQGIGPKRAKQIHEKFGVEDLDDLLLVGEDLTLLPRVGKKRARSMLESAREVKEKS